MTRSETSPVANLNPRTRWYRVLSYYFGVRCDSAGFQGYPHQVLEPFEVVRDPDQERKPPTPGLPPVYSLVEAPSDEALRYRVLHGEEMLYGSDAVGPVLDQFFWHVNSETIRQTGDFFLIHAGAVAVPGVGAILLPGSSGSGKSTLVTGLVRSGFDYLSDEAAAVDPVTRRIHPYPRAISLNPDVMSLVFSDLLEKDGAPGIPKGHWHLQADDVRPGSVSGPLPVRWVIVPSFEPGRETSVETMSRGETAHALGRNAMSLDRYGSRSMPLLAELVQDADCYRMVSGDLESGVAAVRDLTAVETVPGKPLT